MANECLKKLFEGPLSKSGRPVAARLQAAIALLERLREHPELDLASHLSSAGQSLIGHETYGDNAAKRLMLPVINKNHGRRSSSIHEWAQPLLDCLQSNGAAELQELDRLALLDRFQRHLGKELVRLHETSPLIAYAQARTASAMIRDLLEQADTRGLAGPVAQYLVGAKLLLRFPHRADEITVAGANLGDASTGRRGDFDFGETVIEVAMGLPDEKHIGQVAAIVNEHGAEPWLLVRHDRLGAWLNELKGAGVDVRKVVVASVDQFIGQNISELGDLSPSGCIAQIEQLLDIYNERWAMPLGPPGLKIEIA